MRQFYACFLIGSLLLAASAIAGEVPLISQDDQGLPVEAIVTRAEYTRRLTRLVLATQESTLPALKNIRERQNWKLRTVMVGVGLSISAGLGPILTLNATPRFRLAFSNNSDPAFP